MSAEVLEQERRAEVEPVFTILDVAPVVPALAPALRFSLHVSDPLGRDVVTIALSTQVHVEPAKRPYDAETRERLTDLFGTPARWPATTHPFEWARVEVLVPSFTGATSFELQLPVSYDLEIAATRFCWSLPGGHIPVAMHFSGMVVARDDDGRIAIERVPWSCSARWSMPVDAWKRAVSDQFPEGGWVRLEEPTLRALAARRAEQGDHSFDATVRGLL